MEHRHGPGQVLALLLSRGKASARKRRLVAVACCRHFWHLLSDERSRSAVAVAERFADNQADSAELAQAQALAQAAVETERHPGRRLEEAGCTDDDMPLSRMAGHH